MADILNSGVKFTIEGEQSLKNQANNVKRALGKINAEMSDVTGVMQRFNEKGQVVEKVFTGISKEGTKFAVTVSDLEAKFVKVNTQAERFTKILSDQEKETKKQEKAIAALARGTKVLIDRLDERNRKAKDHFVNAQKLASLTRKEIDDRRGLLKIERDLYQARQRANAVVKKAREQITNRDASGRVRVAQIRGSELHALDVKRIGGSISATTIRRLEQSSIDARKATDDLRKSLGLTGKVGKKSGEEVLISWKSVARLFVVQALHQTIAIFRTQMEQAARSAFDFSKSIAEIRTIAGDANETTQDWTQSLRQLSSEFPFKQIELAEAAYQALSNQVIKTTADLGFIREAGKLALVGVSDITTSVNALTSVINAYELSTLRTASTSATLFKTIELGRTRLDSLEENLGRVSILSSRLGVSFAEQQAALATLTIQGLKDNVAKTLLVNIYNKLIRPSKQMNELFAEWGVTSGEAAISTFGFTGTLNKMFAAARESGDAVAFLGETAHRVRATIGLLGLDTEKYGQNLARLSDSTEEFNDTFEEITNTAFVRLKQELADVDTLFLRVGTSFNTLALSLADTFGGLANVITRTAQAVGAFASVMITSRIVKLLSSFVVSANNVRLALTGMSVSAAVASQAFLGLATFGISVAATVLAAYIIHSANWSARVQDHVDDVTKKFRELHKDIVEEGKKAIREWLDSFDRLVQTVDTGFNVISARVTRLNNSLGVDLAKTFEDVGDRADRFGKRVQQAISDALRETQKNIRNIQNELRGLDGAIDSNQELLQRRREQLDIDQIKFQGRKAGASDLQIGEEFARRESLPFLEEALSFFQKASTDRTRSGFERATAAQRALETEERILKVRQRQQKELADEIIEQKNKQKQLEREFDIQQEIRIEQEKAAREFKDAQKDFSDFDPVKRREDLGTDGIGDFDLDTRQILFEFDQKRKALIDTATRAGFDPVEVRRLQQRLEDARTDIATAAAKERNILLRDINLKNFEKDFTEIKRRRTAAEKEFAEGRDGAPAASERIVQALARLRGFLQETNIQSQIIDPAGGPSQPIFVEEREARKNLLSILDKEIKIREDISKELAKFEPDQERLSNLQRLRTELLENLDQSGAFNVLSKAGLLKDDTNLGSDLNVTFKENQELLADAFNKFTESLEQQTRARTELQDVQNALEELRKRSGFDEQQLLAQRENTDSLETLTRRMGDAILAMKDLEAGLLNRQPVPFDPGPGQPLTEVPEFATGGYVNGPSGIDNVPAWLTAGEYVMTRQATHAYLPLLQAMNNSQKFARGGRVQNITIGDITVSGGNTSQATARQIAHDIKREISRGTLSL